MTKESWPKDFIHKEHPKSCAEDDYWGQVSRTVSGRPVGQEQIDMIVAAVCDGLRLDPRHDVLLDLGAGNGALASRFFRSCRSYLGIDFSAHLLKIARKDFERQPNFRFVEADMLHYVESEPQPESFTKALCYGAFSYLSQADAQRMLLLLYHRFHNIESIYVGNLPDKDRSRLFYTDGRDLERLLDDCSTPIGVWRSKHDFEGLAVSAGWQTSFHQMPQSFYSAHYRYDAVLRRPHA